MDHSSKPVSAKHNSLVGIQYLRAVAVVLVVLCHATGMARFDKYFGIDILSGLFIHGAVGVELFFVISGFIITYVSLKSEVLTPKISTPDFFWRRFVRIVPFMWLCVIGYASLKYAGRGTFSALPYLRSLVLFPIGELQPNQIWTLRHEFLFYAIFGITIVAFNRSWTYLCIWLLSPLVWYGLQLGRFFDDLNARLLFDFLFSRMNLLFGMGVALGVIYLKNSPLKNFSIRHGFLICCLLSVLLFGAAKIADIGESIPGFFAVILTGIISLFIIAASLMIAPDSPMNRLDKVGLKLGDASYSIYLTHTAVISFVYGFWSKFQPHAQPIIVLAVVSVICCVAGVLIHDYVEKPLIRALQSASRKYQKSPAVNRQNV